MFILYVILIFSGIVVVSSFLSASYSKEDEGYIYEKEKVVFMAGANMIFMVCLLFVSNYWGVESQKGYIDEKIYKKAISEKAIGFEGDFLYKYKNSETFCIKMKIGKEPEVLSKNFCEKKQEKRVQEKQLFE